MATLTLRARGRADADQVWERYVLPSRWSGWSPQIRGVRTADDRLVAGTTGTVLGPLGVRVAFTVEEVDEDARTWSWQAHVGPVGLHLNHAVRAHPGGAETTLRVRGPLPVVAAYAPLAQLALIRLVAAG